ncbi:MAG TPA: hypothetical protein VG028_04075 [Terriglobia bacterium]|nr:hypothetical protein [Terriglobia bacterium]
MKIESMGCTDPRSSRSRQYPSSASCLGRALGVIALSVLGTGMVLAQQPSTSVAPIFNANAKYVNGVGPGYWPTAGTLLSLNLAAGTAMCGAPPILVTYSGGTLAMAASQTNYVYLDPSLSCAPSSNTTGFVGGQIPLAQVVTSATAITTITDARNWFVPQPVGTDSTGKAVTKYLNNFRFADQFPGSSGTAKLNAAIADFGSNPGMVVAVPGMGTGDASSYANNVSLLDLRQTTDLIAGVTTDPDRPSAILLENQLGELTTLPYSGTVTLSHGSTAVTGVNTHFLTEIGPNNPLIFPIHLGRSIKLNADATTAWAEVASVTDDTHATLTVGYPGTGGTGPASYFITQFPMTIHNVVNAGTPNTTNGGESVGLSVVSDRNGGTRGLYGANFNTTYYTPASAAQAQAITMELDLGNFSGTDDNTSVPSIGLDILSAGPNRPNAGITIGASATNNAFQRGIFVSGWGQTGLLLEGAQDHLQFYTGAAPNSNAQIGGRNVADTAYIWSINNDGSGSFPATVNFNGGIGSTGALALASGSNGNITLTPNGSGSVLIPGASGDNRVYFQTGPATTSFLPGTVQVPLNGSSNATGCLNMSAGKPDCFTSVAQSNDVTANPLGVYGIGVGNAASGAMGIVAGMEGDGYSEGGAGIGGLIGVSGYAEQDGAGTVGTMVALFASSNLKAAGTVTNNYGLLVQPQTAGTNNYAILTQGTAPSAFGGAVVSGMNVVAFSGTPTFDASLGNTQKITLTGNATSSTLANAAAGEQINFIICQDGTGGRSFVWPPTVSQGPPVNLNANGCTYYSTIFDGTNANPLEPPQAQPNITAVTASSAVSTDQNLMSLPLPAATLNVLGKTVNLYGAGTYTTGSSGAGAMTYKVKLCTVSGCGSGTVVTLGTFGPTATQIASSTNIPWSVSLTLSTSTVGASGKVIPNGTLQTVIGTTATAAGAPYLTQTTGQSAAIDLTSATYLQFTVADSGASANDSFTQTLGVLHAFN